MRAQRSNSNAGPAAPDLLRRAVVCCVFLTVATAQSALAQAADTETPEQKLQHLTAAVAQAQAQIEAYQQQLGNLQHQIADLQQQMDTAKVHPAAASSAAENLEAATGVAPAKATASSLEDVRERQAIQESQIATHDLSKVETESKYPLKISGLLLFNGFVNTRKVDIAANPTYALGGAGSTGFSVRQSVLGLDARGPHLFGASSRADLRVDFFGGSNTQSGYAATGLLRLRTAHAALKWANTEAFVELDRSLLSPNEPTSLVATAEPEFAWSGDLWAWNPQIGVSHSIGLSRSSRLLLEAALIDAANPQLPNAATSSATVSLAERSRWPGAEARISWAGREPGTGPQIGVGGYFSPHMTSDGVRFNAWAGTIDLRLPLGKHVEVLASSYRGLALGGLGGGGYVDYFYQYAGTREITRPLDDVGGWTQLKLKPSERVEFNAGYGIDNPFANEIYAMPAYSGVSSYSGLARNRRVFGNVIYSPSLYLLFSLEYRRLWSSYVTGPTYFSDSIGLGAGYRF